jgi:hypothetical protein
MSVLLIPPVAGARVIAPGYFHLVIAQAPELSWQGRIDAFIGGIPVVDE